MKKKLFALLAAVCLLLALFPVAASANADYTVALNAYFAAWNVINVTGGSPQTGDPAAPLAWLGLALLAAAGTSVLLRLRRQHAR